MTSRALSHKYARALFDAVRDPDRSRVAADLDAFAAAVSDHADLAAAFRNPGIPFEVKGRIAEAIAREGGAHDSVMTLVGLLSQHDQLTLIPDLARAFRQRLNAHLKIVDASVTTAVPLSAAQLDAIRSGLAQATGLQVQVSPSLDPSILGGVVAQIGSTVYDGSIVKQLARAREALTRDA